MGNVTRSIRQARRFMWFGSVLSTVIGAILALFGYWALLDRSPPIDRISGRVESIIVRPDGSRVVWVEWTYRRLRTCTGHSERWLVDGVVQPLPSTIVAPAYGQEVGKMATVRVPVEVPSYFHAKGTYRIRTFYQCNPIQAQYPRALSIPFEPPGIPFDLSVATPEGNVQ